MKVYLVASSNVDSVGHDPATDTLAVKFHNGSEYHYHGVSAADHTELLRAPSFGKHLVENFVGKFKYTKQ